jgi:hypothetical protein
MSAVARRPRTSAVDLAEARPMKRLKRRPPPPPPAAAASSIRPEPSSMRPEPFSLRPEPVEGRARLRGSSRRLPVWAARAVFLLGLLNIASAVLRRSPRLLDWSQDYLPPFGAVASVAVVGIGVGCGLLVMARGLRRRKHRALIATVALLGAAIAVHLARGTELIQAAVSAAVVVVLLLGRRQFVGRPDPSSRSAIPLSLSGLGVTALLLGAVTLLTDHHELVRPWTGAEVLQQSLLGMVGIPGPLRFVNANAAAESRYLLVGLGMLTGLAALGVLLHSSAPIKTANDTDRNRIRALLAQHGSSGHPWRAANGLVLAPSYGPGYDCCWLRHAGGSCFPVPSKRQVSAAWEPRFICFALARDLGPIIGAALALEGFLHWPRLTPRRTNSTLAGGPC